MSSSPSSSASASPYPVGVYWESYEEIGVFDDAESYNWYTYFFSELSLPDTYVLLNIPYFENSLLRVTLYGTSIEIGTMVFGKAVDLGDTQWGLELGIRDYSTKETDDFGIITILERDYSKTMSCDMFFEHSKLRGIFKFLASIRATPIVWIGSSESTFDATVIYGFYTDFSIVLRDYGGSFCSLEIEGLI